MVYRGHVENGVIRLDESVTLPEGIGVEVHLVERDEPKPANQAVPSLYERLKPVIGVAKGLPSDLAENHDYYLHGQERR
jgi:hypothetical protein